jgi:hypothetical protein
LLESKACTCSSGRFSPWPGGFSTRLLRGHRPVDLSGRPGRREPVGEQARHGQVDRELAVRPLKEVHQLQ